MPDHLEWIIAALAVVFAFVLDAVAIYLFRKNGKFRQIGIPARLRVLDLALIQSGDSEGGTQTVPIYEVLDGPRAGEKLRSDGKPLSSVATIKTLPESQMSAHQSKLRQIGQERTGWVHPTKPIAMAKQDQALVGGIAIGLIAFSTMVFGFSAFLIAT